MKHRLILTLMACLIASCLLASCHTTPDAPAGTDTATDAATVTETETESVGTAETEPAVETETETVMETETETETETIPETEAATISVGEVESETDLVVTDVYTVTPTESSGKRLVRVGDLTVNFNFESTFFGTESAVDRDSFHWGDLYTFTQNYATKLDVPYVMGDLDGDRRSEQIYMNGTVLTVAKIPENREVEKSRIVLTQDLGVALLPCGTGFFNGDRKTDVLLYDPENGSLWLGLGCDVGFAWVSAGYIPVYPHVNPGDTFCTGDTDGDGVYELVIINDLTVKTCSFDGSTFTLSTTDTLLFAESGRFLHYTVADINSDRRSDVVCYMEDEVDGETRGYLRTYFSRGDGHFGSYEHEGDNKNCNPTATVSVLIKYMTCADTNRDGVDNLFLLGDKKIGKITRSFMFEATHAIEAYAYDYSSHVIRLDDGTYILYSGGTYEDYNTDKYPATPADHLLAYTSTDGVRWFPVLDGATFLLGGEEGFTGYTSGDLDPVTGQGIPGTGDSFGEKWWTGNTMEPEVIKDPTTGIYYMYWQVENYCYNEDGSLMGADRIGVATSTDGIHFERKKDRPVIITDDIFACFTHQEAIYVPDDPDGKCWWMYVRYVHKNNRSDLDGFEKRILLRSDDPTRFDMNEGYEDVEDFGGLGNQTGYISNYDGKGNRLFVRITTTNCIQPHKNHTVPSLSVSLDGRTWKETYIALAGTDMKNPDEANRPNTYFLGMSTINGTGELARNEDGSFTLIYVGCTSRSAVAPEIFYSSEGYGVLHFTLDITES